MQKKNTFQAAAFKVEENSRTLRACLHGVGDPGVVG